MQIIRDLNEPSTTSKPVILTIGNYDGVHLGHKQVLDRVKEVASQCGASPAVLSFTNQPGRVLHTDYKPCRLCTITHKIHLLEKEAIDLLALLTFTKEFSQQSPEIFLSNLMACIPFSHLILGHDARFGKDRSGDRKLVQTLAKKMGFSVEYLASFAVDSTIVSSSLIRQSLEDGDLSEASRFLGRKYSIFEEIVSGQGHGKKIGYPTANIFVNNLCLPPFGVYAVRAKIGNHFFKGIANLGFAPTIRQEETPVLEVHLLEEDQDLYGQKVEIIFEKFIRSEQQFSSVDALKQQISQDIEVAKEFLTK